MSDPVQLKLAERRRYARRLIERGNAMAARGKAELDEADRFEAFYREAVGKTASTNMDLANMFPPAPTVEPAAQVPEAIALKLTLKGAILQILKHHPGGLESNGLLAALHAMGFVNLPRTTMSPQLSRLRASGDVVNVGGRWTLAENKEAANLL